MELCILCGDLAYHDREGCSTHMQTSASTMIYCDFEEPPSCRSGLPSNCNQGSAQRVKLTLIRGAASLAEHPATSAESQYSEHRSMAYNHASVRSDKLCTGAPEPKYAQHRETIFLHVGSRPVQAEPLIRVSLETPELGKDLQHELRVWQSVRARHQDIVTFIKI